MTDLTLAHRRLIEAVAQAIAADYLRSETARRNASDPTRPNHPPLPATEQAA